ncbi:MAG: bifunctional orotidine-5'-phosphate decarboxylase/orotate phosphoribosyltransferase [Snowella sp.]|nr:bifunctional orotidine-5'-phosphate decarboxylase/orotate phosphoribosyltransferase [Snowella sp.]
MSFFEKLNDAIAVNESLLVIALDPSVEMVSRWQQDQPTAPLIERLENWLRFIIRESQGLVCAYKPTLGFYEALGSQGFELLTRILQAIPPQIPIILDAKHGDLNTSTVFAKTIFEDWHVDAVTLSPFAGQDHSAPFLVYPDKGVFMLCHTSNPGAIALQNYPTAENPFYLQVVKEVQTWGPPEQLYLEVGIQEIEVLKKIRSVAPESTLLLRSIWSENNADLTTILQTGLNKLGTGLLIPVSQDLLTQNQLSEHLKTLNQEIRIIRNQIADIDSSCTLWTSNVPPSTNHPHQDLILQLFDIGCLLFGNYVQASGATFSYYIDLRKIISNPQLFHKVLNAYAEILKTLTFDRIAGIPYGSLPTATGLALLLNYPMIYPRKEVKAHGTRRLIEGNYESGETVVVVDDILISGNSAIEGAGKLESSGLKVNDIVVFIDHEEGVKDKLKAKGYNAFSVLTISEITETLYQSGRINQEQYHHLLTAKD